VGLDSDEYCPHCDNHFVLDAVTPQAELRVEVEDPRIDSRYGIPLLTSWGWFNIHFSRAIKDERVAGEAEKTIFSLHDKQASKLG
jgi:hypothetical protein